MSIAATGARATASPRRAVWLALAELVLTAFHHAYGAVIYAAPFRLQVVEISVAVAALVLGLAFFAHHHRHSFAGRLAFRANMLAILAFPVVAIGLVEGGYNHAVKNVVYFLMGNAALYAQLFPAPTYELPTDWLFEATGVAQLPLGLLAGWSALGVLWRAARRSE